ncbi:N-formylglutamate amidohydrolase [Corynebacterium sp. TA-R-1]|uniref:N-formylglutamate amidohydrolase n=1 Tax=Corynebacterium stercoris TaxID=2943490 RepID=A0ABT1FYR7_9CORY|nr:N-formylglutamate amidohydrolase [Corynebacterium stercoris]MCP1386909.1 N-formylglutamate amidohydrolase [Corynebacterium stercoris]
MYSHLAIDEGAQDCPVILHVPHASRHIPEEVAAEFVATPEQVEVELDRVTDTGTDTLAEAAREFAGGRAWSVVSGISRLVADPGRFYNQRDSMDASGRGAVYTRMTDGGLLRPLGFDDAALKAQYFHPYNDAVADVVGGRLRETGGAVIVDVHSYGNQPEEYRIHAGKLLPDVCIGTHSVHSPAILTDTAAEIFARAGFKVERNTPFTGVYIPVGFEMNARVLGIMFEVRDDLLAPGSESATRAAEALGEVIAAAEQIAGTEMGRPQ